VTGAAALVGLLHHARGWAAAGLACALLPPSLLAVNSTINDRHGLPGFLLAASVLLGAAAPWLACAWARLGAARAALGLAVVALFGLQLARETRLSWAHQAYEGNRAHLAVAEAVRPHLTGEGLVVSSYPQLLGWLLDVPTAGSTYLSETLRDVVARHRPAVVVLDDLRWDAPDYSRLVAPAGPERVLPDYEVVVHSPGSRVAVLRRR
jgi:hypothetical protein